MTGAKLESKNAKRHIWRQRAVAMGVSVLLFLGILGSSLYIKNWRLLSGQTTYPIVCLGDSILGMVRDHTSITSLLEQELGNAVFNGAMGGTSMSRMQEDRSLSFQKDGLSMAALSLAIGYQDFGVQKTIRIQEAGTEYFTDMLREMEQIDFSQVQILIIEHGINDYNAGVPIYREEDPYDPYSFTGALRLAITTLQKQYPDLKIYLLTPTYCWFLALEETCEEWNSGYGVLKDYVDAEKQVAGELGVEVIDVYLNGYSHENWEDWKLYTIDGLHPNEEGRKLIAQRVAQAIQKDMAIGGEL